MMFRRGDSDDKHDQHDQPIQPSEVRMADGQGNEVTVVGQGARLEGTVVSAGSLRIDGQVKGKITAEGDVALTSASQVEADIHAQNVTVSGRFRGNIVAQGRAELTRGGRVDGNVTAKALVVAEGAVFNGQSSMDPAKTHPDRAGSPADGGGSAAPAEVSARAK
jgi:adhesin HecA-like repeat protein